MLKSDELKIKGEEGVEEGIIPIRTFIYFEL